MRIALFCAGLPRFNDFFLKTLDNLKNEGVMDLYFFMWNSDFDYRNLFSKIPNNYNVKSLIQIEEPDLGSLTKKKWPDDYPQQVTSDNYNRNIIDICYKQHYGLYKSFLQIKENYDVYVRLRVDGLVSKQINLSDYDVSKGIYCPDGPKFEPKDNPTDSKYTKFNDQFAIANRNNMEIYCSLYSNLDNYFQLGEIPIHHETILQHHLLENNVILYDGGFEHILEDGRKNNNFRFTVKMIKRKNMNDFNSILDLTDGPVQYELSQWGHIKMKQHLYPYSIKIDEFEFLKNLIIENNLQRGYECATAFGISSLALGIGFKQTGGKCVTMDAYIEEKCESYDAYKNFEKQLHETSDGIKSVKYLIEKYNLQDVLFPEIGWSPNDTETILRKHITEPLDFVFIDGGHFPHQVIKDVDVIMPLLGEKYVLAFHDVYPESWGGCFTDQVHEHIFRKTGKRIEIKIPNPVGENLGVIINL